jgi:alpha-L-glutamate ligase-like protein
MFFKSHWLLGQNARNLRYIKWGNFKLAKRLADSKLTTKKYLARHNIAVPETLQIIAKHSEIDKEKIKLFQPPFVIKPNNWYGGKWILIIDEFNAEGNFITNSGDIYSPDKLAEHFIYILDGFYSLSWGRDKVIIEKKIVLTKEIELLGKYGLPDIRIVMYNMVPVMAMIRIPTAESGGKANIHGGACAAWIDIGSGRLTYISSKWKSIKSIPGIGDVRWIIVPDWDRVLTLAVKVQSVTGIKFLGCDVVLDERDGPLLLEINVRPGLEIQNVNLAPLKTRLDKVEWVDVNSVEKWVRIWRDLFSGDIEDKIKSLSGKKVAGQREYLKIFHNEKVLNYIADIRISMWESFISQSFVEEILKIEIGEKTRVKLECEVLWIKKNIAFKISDIWGEETTENIRLWTNALKWFLVDPFKYKKGENPTLINLHELKGKNTAISKTHESQLLALDESLIKIDKKLLILKYVTPTNIDSERQKFIEKSGDYIPKFEYKEIPFDIVELQHELKLIEIPDIPLSELYDKKQQEIYNKLQFLKAFSEQNTSDMTLYSKKVFGDIDEKNFKVAKDLITHRDQVVSEQELLSYEDIKDYMKKFNHIYGIKVKILQADTTARFTMKGDTLIFRRGSIVGKREMRSIIAHEIEGHYLRKINGRKSPFSIMSRGAARYIETDEGIAIYNQNRFITPQDKKYYSIYERYYFTGYALKHSYRRLIKHLAEFYDDDYERVFAYMLRLKRGFVDPSREGVFMKDVVYVNGFLSVEAYLTAWGSLEDLYIWKLHIDDIETIKWHSFFTKHKKDVVIPFSA